MANLYNQNVALNYKGILNLGSVINTPLDATLRSITDGMGNASPLQLSTTTVGITEDLWITNTKRIRNALDASQSIVFTGTLTYNDATRHDFNIGGTTRVNLTATGLAIGRSTTTATARLQVRGDGTNPVARFESLSGLNFFTVNNSGQTIWGSAGANEPYLVNYNGTNTESGSGLSLRIRQRANTGATGNTLIQYWADGLFSGTTSGLAISHEFLSSGFLGSSIGSANYRNITFAYTINNTAAQTGTATGIFLNATETALNGMTHNLMDLQVGGVSKFKVDNNSSVYLSGYYGWTSKSLIKSNIDGNITLYNFNANSFSLLQFGGTTNLFPSIKRNGTTLEAKLADDSNYTGIQASYFYAASVYYDKIGIYTGSTSNAKLLVNSSGFHIEQGVATLISPTAIFQLNSTNQGFLMPRMTEIQITSIPSPADGLMVYNTDIKAPCFYNGNTMQWQKMSHSIM